jgi:branched-chain amino acid transport system ATP-binding protein
MSVPAASTAASLELRDVRAGYGETVVLNGISLSLAGGDTLALLGRNGVGKTTLLATIMGHTRMHGGSIGFRGTDISAMPIHRRNEHGVALVPQEREIFKSLSVEENLLVGERPGKWTADLVFEFFPGLARRRKSRGDQLSGGEQQMLAVGRALMGNPQMLLLDEPLEGLAPVIVDQLLAGLQRLKAEERMTMILVEQHAHLAMEFAASTVVLDRGAIVYQGASAALAASPEKMSALLGIGKMGTATDRH